MSRFNNLIHLAMLGLLTPPRDEHSDLLVSEPVTMHIDPKADRLFDVEVEDVSIRESDTFIAGADTAVSLVKDIKVGEIITKIIKLPWILENIVDNFHDFIISNSVTFLSNIGYLPRMQDIARAEEVPLNVLEAAFERDFLLGSLHLDGKLVAPFEAIFYQDVPEGAILGSLSQGVGDTDYDIFAEPVSEQETIRMYRNEDGPREEIIEAPCLGQARERTFGDLGVGEWVDRDTLFDNSIAAGPTFEMSPGNLKYDGVGTIVPELERFGAGLEDLDLSTEEGVRAFLDEYDLQIGVYRIKPNSEE